MMLVVPRVALADSYAGSDWTVDLTGYLNAPLGMSQNVSESAVPTTIGQTSDSVIDIPLNIPAYSLNIDVPGTVSGTHITAETFLAGPINVTVSGYALKLYNVTAHLEGDATTINPLDASGGFGPRVYGITGDPTGGADGTSYVDVGSVKLGLLNLGAASVDIYSWDANRSATAAPEPGTLVLLLGMGVSLAGFSWRKRRISR
jgi:hypothetical protein